MRSGASFRSSVDLIGARIGSNLEMDGSSFAGAVNAAASNVTGSLFMRGGARFNNSVDLIGASIGGNLEMTGSTFTGPVNAASITVAANLFMDNQAKFSGPVNLVGAKVGGDLELWDATAWRIDLSGAEAQEVLLEGLGWWCAGGKAPTSGEPGSTKADPEPLPAHWRLGSPWRNAQCGGTDPTKLPALILRNAHFADFQDSPEAWPPSLDLEGFHYDRLGAFGGTGRIDMRHRSSEDWADWLARDQTFSTQPYTQLSSVLAAAGHRDTADAIQLVGREQERGEACKDWSRPFSCMWLTFLSYVAGYGIGLYTFWVLPWVFGLTLLGAIILWYSPNARRHGPIWLVGASLHRLLPIIELSKEFSDFFDNPPPQFDEEPNLNRFQVAYFAGHSILGWILSFILIAAMGGIIQKA